VTIEEVVPRVTIWRGQETRVSALSGGLTNDNYLVEAGGVRYVVRIPGRSTELLAIDRANEHANAVAAAQAGVGPAVLEYLADVEVMVLEFIPGETMSGETLRSSRMARRMAASIRELHAGPRFLRDFDMFRLTERYLAICNRRGFRTPAGFHERMATVAAVEGALRAQPLQTVPCHNDLLAENYIDDGERLRLLDYEYSGNNDPTFELANTAQECEYDDELRAVLCEAYFGHVDDALLGRMRLQALMSDLGWTLWAAIQQEISAIDYDFWGWAEQRWARAVEIMDDPGFPALLQAVTGESRRPPA
jgi:thiamine kinase-like enzyme